MATTFADLEANVDIMKAGNTNFLIDPSTNILYTDAALKALEKAGAKEILERALIRACKIDQENTTDKDDIADLNEDQLEEALAYLQLHLIFLNMDDGGDDDQARFRSILWGNRYKEYMAKFPTIMKRNEGETYNTTGHIEIGG